MHFRARRGASGRGGDTSKTASCRTMWQVRGKRPLPMPLPLSSKTHNVRVLLTSGIPIQTASNTPPVSDSRGPRGIPEAFHPKSSGQCTSPPITPLGQRPIAEDLRRRRRSSQRRDPLSKEPSVPSKYMSRWWLRLRCASRWRALQNMQNVAMPSSCEQVRGGVQACGRDGPHCRHSRS